MLATMTDFMTAGVDTMRAYISNEGLVGENEPKEIGNSLGRLHLHI